MKTKTDRELLELAAKAAEYWSNEFNCIFDIPHLNWNPLLSDGDAFRLAVKLQLTVCNDQVASGYTYCTDVDKDVNFPAVHSGKNENKVIDEDYVAARRAIVLAAAKIGESK